MRPRFLWKCSIISDPFGDYSVLHYGAYEVRALRRMQRKLPADYAGQLEDMLKRTINVLSVIGRTFIFPCFQIA